MTVTTPARKPCIAPKTSTTKCGERSTGTFKGSVPGGTISGASCTRHFSVVQQIVNE